jgi:hypothetical protein
MQKKLPKAVVFIEKISRINKYEFLVISQIKPFGIPLSIEMDKEYFIKNVSLTTPDDSYFSDDYKLEANKIVLPFHLIDGFMMIDGDVQGKKGKFLFDTGTPFGILLNNHYLNIQKKDLVISGNAGSGQVLDIYLEEAIDINIGNQVGYNKLDIVPNSDFSFIEKGIVSEFLGFIGYDFFKNYEILINYDYQTITLNKLDKKGTVIYPYVLPNEVVTTFQFTTTNAKQIPIVALNIGLNPIEAHFDTGNQGNISLNKSTFSSLLQQGILSNEQQGNRYGEALDDLKTYTIDRIHYAQTPLLPVKNLSFKESDENILGFGYQFLKNYISIWNFQKKTITLLQK